MPSSIQVTFLALSLVQATIWPRIQEVEKLFALDMTQPEIEIHEPIRDEEGKVRYLLVCRGGSGNAMEPIFSSPLPHIYARPLTCVLHPGEREGWGNLLTRPFDVIDSDMRGYFDLEDLQPPCDQVPELGHERSFRLRGMRLTISARAREARTLPKRSDGRSDDVYAPARVSMDRLSLHVTVTNNAGALTARASPPASDLGSAEFVRLKERCANIRRFLAVRQLESYCLNVMTWKREWKCVKEEVFEPFIWELHPYNGPFSPAQHESRRKKLSAFSDWIVNFPKFPKGLFWNGPEAEEFAHYRDWFDSWRTRLEDAVASAVQSEEAEDLAPFLPPRPFLFQCGEPGTSSWQGLIVETEDDWSGLWTALARNVKRRFGDVAPDASIRVSELYGFRFWGGLVYLQDGLTIGSTLGCDDLLAASRGR